MAGGIAKGVFFGSMFVVDIRCMPLFAREARAAEGGKGAYNEGNRTF